MSESVSQAYKPLVSIVIPVYNGAAYLREAIDSAIDQTYTRTEIIVVDDGSDDGGQTAAVARSYGSAIQYVRKENGGCASALNYGIGCMKGEWFSWLSHDDVYLPDKIASAVRAIVDHNLDPLTIVGCGEALIDAEGRPIPRPTLRRTRLRAGIDAADWLLRGNTPNGCGLLVPKRVLDEVGGFNTKHVYILDWEHWVRMALMGYPFFLYPDQLVKNRRHAAQVSRTASELHSRELHEFASELVGMAITSRRLDAPTLERIWLYCARIGAAADRTRLERHMEVLGRTPSLGVRVRGNWRRLKNDAKPHAKRIVGRFL